MKNHKIIVLIAAAGWLSAALPVFAQGAAFTYQGRLNDGANPATGIYDLQFTIYDSTNLPGTVIAGPVTNTATGVSNGLFTVRLDFGAGVFTGPARWLEIGVRTNGGTTFATLAPRQSLTPSPYAIMAGSASNLLGTLPAGQVSGQLLSAQIADGAVTAAKVDNTQVQLRVSGSAPAGQFITAIAANGSVSAAPDTTNWKLNGNTGTTPGANFLGTADNQPVEIKVNSQRALRLEPGNFSSVNVVGGASVNGVASGVSGATIAGGGAGSYGGSPYSNSVAANFGMIGGGLRNQIGLIADHAVIGGGEENQIWFGGQGSFIGGGDDNQIGTNSFNAVVNGGAFNNISDDANYSVIAGGAGNFIGTSNNNTTIGGGYYNSILENTSGFISGAIIGGGVFNHILTNVNDSTIGGGNSCAIGPVVDGATIAGGYINQVRNNSDYATIGGGLQNTILPNSDYATIPGGYLNSATNQAFAAGTRAKAVNTGAFVWADSQNADFASTGTNQFLIRASGGVGIGINNPQSALHVNGTVTAANFSGSMSGLFKSAFATGFTSNSIAGGALVDSFVGSTTPGLALAAGQKVLVSVTAMLGTTAASDTFNFSPGYTFNGGAVTETSPVNYMVGIATTAGGRQSYSVTHVFTVPATGTYVFGFAILNNGANSLNNNDWMSVSVLAFN